MNIKNALETIEEQIIDERSYYSEQETEFDKGSYKAFSSCLYMVQGFLEELKDLE